MKARYLLGQFYYDKISSPEGMLIKEVRDKIHMDVAKIKRQLAKYIPKKVLDNIFDVNIKITQIKDLIWIPKLTIKENGEN